MYVMSSKNSPSARKLKGETDVDEEQIQVREGFKFTVFC